MAQLSPFAAPAGAAVFDAGALPGHDFAASRADPNINLFDALRAQIDSYEKSGRHVLIVAYSAGSADRLKSVMKDHGMAEPAPVADWAAFRALPQSAPGLAVLPLEKGYEADGAALITEQDILGDRLSRPARRRANLDHFIAEVSALNAGDLVVHEEHGIGRYDGLVTLEVAGAPHDCLRVVYAGDDKLFVPVENIEVLSRYGSEDAAAQLDRLGGVAWQSRKARVKARIRDIAGELIEIAAERQLREGEAMAPPEGMYDEFAARFPYPETEDQEKAIRDTLGRSGVGQADRPAHLRRRGLRQDRSGVARGLRRGDGGNPGGGGGADDAAGAPALPQLRRAFRRLAGEDRAAVALRARQARRAGEGRHGARAGSISSSAPTRFWPRASPSSIWACWWWTRSSISAWRRRSA